jgi:hypothetical protein
MTPIMLFAKPKTEACSVTTIDPHAKISLKLQDNL